MQAYKAEQEDEISLELGETIEVIHKLLDGWWVVRYDMVSQLNLQFPSALRSSLFICAYTTLLFWFTLSALIASFSEKKL